MPSPDDERQAALERALTDTQGQGVAAQAEAVRRVLITTPSPQATDDIWRFLVRGLIVLVGIALIGMIALIVADKYDAVILTAFTALLTGLLGLFIDAPARDGADT